ncbi:hypothetical protein [Streptomyces mirabilis]|uniref:hypothetical protein n=1 Tax=Streptomyces mirabilis TaxID=68239 RepID=UPI0033CEC761
MNFLHPTDERDRPESTPWARGEAGWWKPANRATRAWTGGSWYVPMCSVISRARPSISSAFTIARTNEW